MGLRKKLVDFWRDERGQSTTEYILILAVVVMIAMKFRESIGDQIRDATEQLGQEIESALDGTTSP